MDMLTKEEIYILAKKKAGGGGDITVEELNVTENGQYTAPSGKAYSPVNVNVPQTTIESLSITENGTYTAPSGKAYSPVSVDVPLPENAYYLKESLEANPLSISDGEGLHCESAKVTMLPIQDLHGYDAPWPAGGGKNKLDDNITFQDPSDTSFSNTAKRTFGSKTYFYGLAVNNYFRRNNVTDVTYINGVFKYKITSNGYGLGIPITGLTVGQTYTVSAVLNSNATIRGIVFYAQDGTWLTTVNTPPTFTIPSDTYYTCILFSATTENTECTVSNIQLEEGQTATSYAPYSNICPIEGHTSASVTRTGKNLVNLTGITTGTAIVTHTFLKPLANTITVSARNNNVSVTTPVWRVRVEYQDGTLLYVGDSGYAGGTFPKTFTADSNNPIVSVAARGDLMTSGSYDIQAELGSTATEYEPYSAQTHTATFPSTVYGGEYEFVEGTLTDDWALIDLGSLTYTYRESQHMFSAPLTGYVKPTTNTEYPKIISSQYATATINMLISTVTDDNVISVGRPNNWDNYVMIRDSRYTDATDFKTAMNGVKLAYELATPTETTLTPQSIELNKGTNVLSTDGDTVQVEYWSKNNS